MQILNLITSEDYLDKKIGYLGLTQLFCENSEVLMLATHSMGKDLESSN
jgi:AP-1 complex subunit gamma-1